MKLLRTVLAVAAASVLGAVTMFGVSGTASAATSETTLASGPSDTCNGAGGVLNNLFTGAIGSVYPPIFYEKKLGTPSVDGANVRADNTVSFKSYGSCMAQVAFKLQTKVCGFWGCNWETRGDSTYEYLWKYADLGVGEVSQQVSMPCRKGTHSYRVHLEVVGPATVSEEPNSKGKRAAIGVDGTASAKESQDGSVVKLTC